MESLIQENKILTQELAKKTETIVELQNSLEIVRAQCLSLNDQITILKGGSNQEENCEVVDSDTATSLNNINLRESKKEEICCPLCCKESFATKEDLKVHLSKIIEDTFCSICSLKCDRLSFIKKHVNNGCNINSNIEGFLNDKSAVEDGNDEIIKTMALISFKMPGVQFNIDRNSFNGIRIIEDNDEEVKNELIEENRKINNFDKSYPNWLIEKRRNLKLKRKLKREKNSTIAKVRKHNVKPLPLDKKFDFQENNSDETDLDWSYEEPRNINNSILQVRKESNLNTSDTSNDELNSDGFSSWSDDESSSDENSSSSELNYSSHENSYHSDVQLRKNKKSSKSPNNDDKEYFCSACNMSFKNLINHIKERHVGESVKVEGGIEELEKKLKSHENLKKKPTKPSTPSNRAMPQNKTNFWVKRDCVFNFVGDEKKMLSLYPKFIPSENVVKPLIKNQNASAKLFTYLKKIVCIKYFGDSSLFDDNIFVTNKKIDRATLGPLAKLVSSWNDTETNESDDELDVFKGANRKEINMYIICANIDDEEISIENVDFYALPPVPKKVIPFLSNVTNPPIPLLKGSKQLKFQCNNCGSSVPPSVDGYNHHTCYKCKYCGKNFKKEMCFFMNHLNECVKIKASVPLPSFACSSCPSRFNSYEEVQDHMLLHYYNSDAAQCGICYCHFKRKTILCEHLKSEHHLEDSQMESAIRNPVMCENFRNTDIKTPLFYHKMNETSKIIENQDNITIPVDTLNKEEATKEILNLTLTRSNRKRKVNSSFSEYIYY
uniref:C2H2-type domain-containing protein n=1 Tax=Clastoptera arizonana TaxID=38151 RepID=A0A1B6C8D8_9HEMI